MKKLLCILFIWITQINMIAQSFNISELPIVDKKYGYRITTSPFIDSTGDLWYSVNIKGTFCRYDGTKNHYYNFYNKEIRSSIYHYKIYFWAEDSQQRIWAVSSNEIFVIDKFKNKITKIKLLENQLVLNPQFINGYFDENNNFWLTLNSTNLFKITPNLQAEIYPRTYFLKESELGLYESNFGENGIRFFQINQKNKLLSLRYKLFEEKNGKINFINYLKDHFPNISENYIIISNNSAFNNKKSGSYLFNNINYEYYYYAKYNAYIVNLPSKIKSNALFKGNKVLNIDGLLCEMYEFSSNKLILKESYSFASPIENNRLYDNKFQAFVLASSKNIYKLKLNDYGIERFLYNQTKSISSREIIKWNESDFYVATYCGLYKFNNQHQYDIYNDLSQKINVTSSLIDLKDGYLWACGNGSSLNRFDPHTKTFKAFLRPGNIKVVEIVAYSPNEILLYTGNNFKIYHTKNNQVSDATFLSDFFKDAKIYLLQKNIDNRIFISTSIGAFLYNQEKNVVTKFPFTDAQNNHVISFFHDSYSQNYILGTINKGAYFYDKNLNFKNIVNIKEGLSSNSVCGIESNKNCIIFATYYGMTIFDRKTKKTNNIYEINGFTDNEFNGRSVYKENDSIFYFGGINGLNKINVNKISFEDKNFYLKLNYLKYHFKNKSITKYHNDTISIKETINLSADENNLKINIGPLLSIESNDYKYYYKIENVNEYWTEFEKSGDLNLNSLPVGDYNILLYAQRYDNISSINTISIPIHIKTPLLKDFRFYILIVICIGTIFYILYRYHIKQNKKKFEDVKEKILLKSNLLRNQMSPHFLFNVLNNLQSVILLKDILTVNKYFTAFAKTLRQTLDFTRRDWITLDEEESYLKNYIILNELQFGDQFQIKMNGLQEIENKNNIYLPSMFLQPFIENAILHGLMPKITEPKTLDLNFTTFQKDTIDYLKIEIIDNGVGRKLQNHSKTETSHATDILKERLKIWNLEDNSKISFEIIDQVHNGNPTGTLVSILIKFT